VANEQQQYLDRAARRLRRQFLAEAPDPVLVTYGFPSARALSLKKRRVGECWHSGAEPEGYNAVIFVSPILWTDPVEVLATLLHEMIHAAEPKGGHRAPFSRLARRCGFTRPWTRTPLSPELREKLAALAVSLGEFPAAGMRIKIPRRGSKGSRLRLWECECPVKVRVASDDFDATCGACVEPFKRRD